MLQNIIVRLVLYYLSWLVFLAGAFHFLPRMRFYLSQQRDLFVVGPLAESDAVGTAIMERIGEGLRRLVEQDGINLLVDASNTVPVVVALTLAFALTLPVTWVYRWTREHKKYSQSFVHALLVMPIAISLVVFPGQGQHRDGLRTRGNRGRGSLSGDDQGANGWRLPVDGHRDRTRRRHTVHHRGLPRVADLRCDRAGCLEERFRSGAAGIVRLENRYPSGTGAGTGGGGHTEVAG